MRLRTLGFEIILVRLILVLHMPLALQAFPASHWALIRPFRGHSLNFGPGARVATRAKLYMLQVELGFAVCTTRLGRCPGSAYVSVWGCVV